MECPMNDMSVITHPGLISHNMVLFQDSNILILRGTLQGILVVLDHTHTASIGGGDYMQH